jgi:serine/threonine protein kinase
VWSLGITVIEMAEMLPPRAHLHPMKVLTRIPQLPAPKLETPNTFSALMTSFVESALVKDPNKRATAQRLATHAWITSRDTKFCVEAIVDCVRRGRELIAKVSASNLEERK